ncbi:hypothetical protein BDV06DRAFT_194632 [Aspergillus oleicola]
MESFDELIWFLRILFDELESVESEFSICNTFLCEETANPEARMDISLPALRLVQSLEVIGTMSSLSAPELRSIEYPAFAVDYYPGTGSGLKLALWGKHVDVALPKLRHVEEEMVIRGNITSFLLNFHGDS